MPQQEQSTQTQQNKKNKPKVEPVVVPEQAHQTGLATLPDGPLSAAGDGSIEAQAARLGDPRLQTVQRQALAGQIGRLQGNQHLQQTLAALQGGNDTAGTPATAINGNGVKTSGTRSAVARKAEAVDTADQEVGEEGLGSSGPPTMAPAEPPSDGNRANRNGMGRVIQRQDETEAEDLPSEAEKKIALAKARAVEQGAAKTANEGNQQIEKSKAEKNVEKQAGQTAKEKAVAEKAAAGQAKTAGKEAAQAEAAVANEAAPKAGAAGATTAAPNGTGPEPMGQVDPGAAEYKAPASPEEDPAFQAVVKGVKGVAAKQKAHAPAKTKSKEAQDAAESPASETEAKAQTNQVGEMDQAETPGFDAKAFKAQLMQRIADMAPQNAEDADNFKNDNKLGDVKEEMQGQVSEEKEASQGPMQEATEKAPDTGAVPEKPVTPLPPAEPGAPPSNIGAESAVPKPKGTGEVETPLKQETKKVDQEMAGANVTEQQLAKSNEPEFQAALGAKQEAKSHAEEAGPNFRQTEQEQIAQAQGEAATMAAENTQAMHGDRVRLLEQTAGQQGQAKSKDEQARAKIAGRIQTIYNETKTKVETILNGLDEKVNKAFDEGAKEARQVFEDYVEEKMEAYKERRYGGWFGWARWLKDKVAGMPSEVNAFYQEGRKRYLKKMDAVIDNVVSIIGRSLTEAKAEIARGKKEIQVYVAGLPQELQKVGQEAANDIQDKFDDLENQVDSKQDELIDTLAQKYQENLEAVDARIEELKEANKGLVQKAIDAVKGVIETIMKLKEMLMTVLAKIAAVVGKIIDDPIGFLGNLIKGLKQGFQNFVSNILTHLQTGLIGWLTGALGPMGITLPDDIFSSKGIFSLVTQILGLTWPYIRKKAVKLLGEPVVKALETGFEIFQILVNEGPAGLWEYVKDQFSDLKEMVMDQIKEMLITQVIKAGIKWLMGLLNPAAAFVKAAMTIYDIVMFIFERGSQILEFINAVVDAIAAIANGAVGGAAKLVENALAKALPLVIGLLANLLGLGGLAKKVQKIIKKVRKKIDKAINKVIMKAKKAAKKLLRKMGIGKKKEDVLDERTDAEKKADLHKGVGEATKLLDEDTATPNGVRKELPKIESKYRFTSLKLVNDSGTTYHIEGKINPEETGPPKKLEGSSEEQIAAAVTEATSAKNEAIAHLRTLRRAQDRRKKTVAWAGGKPFVSGWKSPEASLATMSVLFEEGKEKERGIRAGGSSVEEHGLEYIATGKKPEVEGLEYDPRGSGGADQRVSGKYVASHAEKQAAQFAPNSPIGVTRGMCSDCQNYFKALAKRTQKVQVVADPNVVRVFHIDGTVEKR